MKGQVIGVEAYNPPNSDRTNADLTKGLIAVKGQGIVDAIDLHGGTADTAHPTYSRGDFSTSEPGGDNFCNVPTLTVAEQNLPFVPEVPPTGDPDAGPDAFDPGAPAIPAQDIKYAWSNIKIIVKPTGLGNQLVGDLTYTTDTSEDGGAPTHCEATYRVRALFPQIPCEHPATDAGPATPDFCQCLPYADPANGRALGSGIQPDLFGPQPPPSAACELSPANATALEAAARVACDPDLHMCVLKAEPTN